MLALLSKRRKQQPFEINADPRKAYESISFGSVFSALNDAIESRQRLIVLTGEAGSGKTLLLRVLYETYVRNDHTVFLRRGDATEELIASLLTELQSSRIPVEREHRMRELGLRLAQRPGPAVLLVDDADLVSSRTLVELAALASWPHGGTDGLRIVLAGGPTLKERLGRRGFAEIARPSAPSVRLGPLLRCELAQYIEHHLVLARHGRVFFSASALDQLLFHSRGIPQQVNLLCARALASRKTHIGAAEIDMAAVITRIASPDRGQASRTAPRNLPAITSEHQSGSPRIRSSRLGSRMARRAAAIAALAGIGLGVAYLRPHDLEPFRLDAIDFTQVKSLGGAVAQSWSVELMRPRDVVIPSIPLIPAAEAESVRIDSPRDPVRAAETKPADDASLRPADAAPVATHLWPGSDMPADTRPDAAPAMEALSLPPMAPVSPDVQQGVISAEGQDAAVVEAADELQKQTGGATSTATGPAQDEQRPAASAPALAPRESAGAATMPVARRPAIDTAPLMARGRTFLQQGDIASARLFFERAAEHGDVAAMTALGLTFDPLELRRLGVVGIKGDADRAMELYRSAAAAGDPTARQSMRRLSDWIERTR